MQTSFISQLRLLHQYRKHVTEKAMQTTDGSDLLDKLMDSANTKLIFVARGSFGNVFYLNHLLPMAVKFVPGMKDSKYKASQQALVAKALEKLVVEKQTPHISLVVTAFWIELVLCQKKPYIFQIKLEDLWKKH